MVVLLKFNMHMAMERKGEKEEGTSVGIAWILGSVIITYVL